MSEFCGSNYINGITTSIRKDFLSINPSTEEPLGSFPKSTKEEVNQAVVAAQQAFKQWRLVSRVQRAEYFDRLCQELKTRTNDIAEMISLETGKTLNESKAEVVEALHMAQYCFSKGRASCGEVVASEINERESYIIRKPKGVVAAITPWNFPFAIHFWCCGPALLEGNTVVFKPSEETPWVGQLIAKLYAAAGFPVGVFNLIHGDGETGATLVEHPQVDHICFTGSAEVGMSIRKACAASWHKTCSCELGSKSAVIVMDDANVDLALSACIASAFKLSGQRCVSSGRMLIHQNLYEDFSKRFVELASKIVIGDPFTEPNALYGPLINEAQLSRVEGANGLTRLDPTTKVLLQGERLCRKGYYLTPHVYQAEWSDKLYLKQEVFGPHVALIPFKDMDDAIRIYNDTEYGLAVGVITNDYRKMREMKQQCDAGMIYFNLGSIGAESHLPFTGLKRSGNGSSAAGTFDAVVHKVSVTVNHSETMNFPQGLT